MKRERKQTQTSNFLAFPYFSNILVLWIHLYCCMSGVRPLFGTHSKMGAAIFICIYIFMAGVQLLSLPRYISQSTNSLTVVVPLLTPGVGGRTYLFLVAPHQCWRFGTSGVFFSSHLPVTGWPITSALAWFVRGRLAVLFLRLTAYFLITFFFFLSFPRN